jgi:hypothetical protein
MKFVLSRIVGLSVAVGFVAGCDDGRRAVVPVSGRITLDGRPLNNVRVAFQPEGGIEPGPGSFALTDIDGRYTLTVIGPRGKAGGTVGRNRVTLSRPDVEVEIAPADYEKPNLPASKEMIPEKYRRESAPLTFDVPDDGTNEANFDLASK